MAGGHTQSSTWPTGEPNPTKSRPPTPTNSAGATAQRCGWSVNRTDSTANIAQPRANPHRTAPVTAGSSAGINGAAARRNPATSPMANEPATTQPMFPLDPGSEWDGRSRPVSLGVGSVATMTPFHAPFGGARLARAVNATLSDDH